MKRYLLSGAVFTATFAVCYLAVCFLIPGMRIKLAAEPSVYFIESVKHMAALKSVISLFAALFTGAVTSLFYKKNKNSTDI